ncbi:hypothetical protein I7I48_07280 [Histoplasma ohiense]|nr:hypothetical protein I7I48_07280 [Histoplasma ohiense (nom. inval.)]
MLELSSRPPLQYVRFQQPCPHISSKKGVLKLRPGFRRVYFSFRSHSRQGLNMEGIFHFSCFRLSPSLVQLPGRKYMQYPEIFLSSYGPIMTVPETNGFSPADVFADTRRAQGRKASPRADCPQKEKGFPT